MITDELRRYASGFAGMLGVTTAATTTDVKDDLEEIADRIDKAHDDELIQAKAVVLLDCISVADDFIELPKDADGKTIRIGDRIEYNTGGRDTVRFLTLNHDGWVVNERGWKAETMHHIQPDSWERIISDALRADRTDAYAASTSMLCELVERCKRLAGEQE